MNTGTEPLSSLRARLGAVLEAVLNLGLQVDPDFAEDLRGLDGRSIALTWSGPQWGLRMAVVDGRIRVGPNAGESDLSLATTLSGLIGLLRPAAARGLPAGRVQISGDAELLRRIEQLSKRFAPDWDAAFAHHLGPTLGPQVGRALADALRQARGSAQSLAETASEYLREESRDVASKREIDEFADAVDHLRDDVERIAARVDRLNRNR